MKKSLIFGGAFTVVFLGSYVSLWHVNTGHLVKETDELLTAARTQLGNEVFSYSTIQGEGFPGAPAVTIKDPKLNLGGIFEISAPAVNYKHGILSNTISETIPGDVTFKFSTPLNKDNSMEFSYKTTDGSLQLSYKGGGIKDFVFGRMSINPFKGQKIDETVLKNFFLNDFESVEMKASSIEIAAKNSGKALMKTGPSLIKFGLSKVDETNHKIDIIYNIKDGEYTEEFDKLMASFADTMKEATGQDLSVLKLIQFSSYGKMNVTFDLTYKGPLQFDHFAETGGAVDLQINNYDVTDKLQTLKSKGSIQAKVSKGGAPEDLTIKLNMSYKATKELQELLKKIYKGAAQVQLDQLAQQGQTDQAAAMAMVEHVFAMYADKIFPDFEKMGELKSNIDLHYTKASDTLSADISVSTDRFGFAFKGQGQPQNRKLNLDMNLKNYQEFIDSLYEYAKGLLEIAHELTGGQVNINLNDDLKKLVVELLKKIAEKSEAGSKDMLIKLSIDGDQVKIGNLGMGELMMLGMTMLPLLQGGADTLPSQPGAPAQPEPGKPTKTGIPPHTVPDMGGKLPDMGPAGDDEFVDEDKK